MPISTWVGFYKTFPTRGKTLFVPGESECETRFILTQAKPTSQQLVHTSLKFPPSLTAWEKGMSSITKSNEPDEVR